MLSLFPDISHAGGGLPLSPCTFSMSNNHVSARANIYELASAQVGLQQTI